MTDNVADAGTRLSAQVAEEIRALLARRRISGRELARQMGASPSWVNFRLTGAQPISLDDLQRFAEALHVGVADLLPLAVTGRVVVHAESLGRQTTVPKSSLAKRLRPISHQKQTRPKDTTRHPVRITPVLMMAA